MMFNIQVVQMRKYSFEIRCSDGDRKLLVKGILNKIFASRFLDEYLSAKNMKNEVQIEII